MKPPGMLGACTHCAAARWRLWSHARAPPTRSLQALPGQSRHAADRTPPRVAGAVQLVGERAIEVLCGSAVHPRARGDLMSTMMVPVPLRSIPTRVGTSAFACHSDNVNALSPE